MEMKTEKQAGIKTTRAKIILQETKKLRKKISHVRKEIQKLNDCIQLANHNMEKLDKTFGEYSAGKKLSKPEDNGQFNEPLNVDAKLIAETIHADTIRINNLSRRGVYRRIVPALLGFVERTTDGAVPVQASRGRHPEEIKILPDVVNILLRISERLPE